VVFFPAVFGLNNKLSNLFYVGKTSASGKNGVFFEFVNKRGRQIQVNNCVIF